ncbi:unnamed protein product, partial [Ostreobium quekettii]
QAEDTLDIAKDTAKLIRAFITVHKFATAHILFDEMRKLSADLQQAKPAELVVGNVTRRVLQFIREEYQHERSEAASTMGNGAVSASGACSPEPTLGQGGGRPMMRDYSLGTLLDIMPTRSGRRSPLDRVPTSPTSPQSPPGGGGEGMSTKKRKPQQWRRVKGVIEGITEMLTDLENIPFQVAEHGINHIHAKEVILVLGESRTTLQLLEMAKGKCPDLHVVVVEGSPRYEGHSMANQLAGAKIQTTIVTDAAVFAMMARVSQVFISCRYLLANGGIIAPSGAHTIALAAHRHGVPFVVLVGLYKLAPVFPHDPTVNLNDFRCPFDIADFNLAAEAKGSGDGDSDGCSVSVVNPSFDYVPPELISLLVTDQGGVTPSYVYRLLKETYAPEDTLLSESVYGFMTS